MRLIYFFALLLLFAACKTTHPDTQSTTQVQQHDSLVQYSQERRTQTLSLDQWQEVEWEMDTGSIAPPTDTLSPFPALATFTEVKQGKAHKVVMRAPHLSLKIKRVTQQQAQDQQQIQQMHQQQRQKLHQHHFQQQEQETPQQLWWKLFWVVLAVVMATIIVKREK